MRIAILLFIFSSFAAHASPFISVKDRLRIDLWINGLEDKPASPKAKPSKPLPEEIERIIKKI
jgi:hypothetical protein